MAEKLELFYPIKNAPITQVFGMNGEWYRKNGIDILGHNGIDFLAYDGQPIRAAHDGVVIFSGVDTLNGEYIEIATTEEKNIGEIIAYAKTVYVHFQRGGRLKQAGDMVKVGDVIGYADSTGLSTGTHLHFGLKRGKMMFDPYEFGTLDKTNGYLGAIDPKPYFTKYAAEDATLVKNIMKQIIGLLEKCLSLFKETKR